jgi:hypothetical protein
LFVQKNISDELRFNAQSSPSEFRRLLRPLHHPAAQGGPPPPLARGRKKKRKETAVRKRSEPDPKSQKYRDRYFAAQELVVRAYCDFFGFWRTCPYRPCRRARGCRGDDIDCMVDRRGGETHRFDVARAHVRARIPKDAGPPERHAWMSDCCTVTWAKSPRKKKL